MLLACVMLQVKSSHKGQWSIAVRAYGAAVNLKRIRRSISIIVRLPVEGGLMIGAWFARTGLLIGKFYLLSETC